MTSQTVLPGADDVLQQHRKRRVGVAERDQDDFGNFPNFVDAGVTAFIFVMATCATSAAYACYYWRIWWPGATIVLGVMSMLIFGLGIYTVIDHRLRH